MRLSSTDRREQVIRVASELFASQGFKGTTTRQIAEAAQVNEAILFRHFPCKEDLYWAVIEAKCAVRIDPGKKILDELTRSCKDDREILTRIAADMLERHQQDANFSRLLLFSALEHHRLSKRFFETYVTGFYEGLASFIRKRQREGAYKKCDALLAARGFIGMVVYHHLIQEIFSGKEIKEFDLQQVAKTFAEIWLAGMTNRAATRPKKSPIHIARNGMAARAASTIARNRA